MAPSRGEKKRGLSLFFVSDVGFDGFPVLPHPVAPPLGLASIHQLLEGLAHLLDVLRIQDHADETARVRVHGGLPELLGAHLAEALEARNFPAAFPDLFL